MSKRSGLAALLLGATLLTACGEPVDQSSIETPPAEAPPPEAAVVMTDELVQAATPLEICLRDAQTTPTIDACYNSELGVRQSELERYLIAARGKITAAENDPANFDAAQTQWSGFRDNYCATVQALWGDATIATARTVSCRIDLTSARTHQLWKDYLTNEDTAEPDLPEPTAG